MKKWIAAGILFGTLIAVSPSKAHAGIQETSIISQIIITQQQQGSVEQEAGVVWDTISALLGGPIGKAFALILIIGGIIAMAIGQIQYGLIAFVAGILIAAAPAIINAIFG